MATRLLDFSDIVEAVANEVGVPLSDSITIAKIKFDINMIYENEVVPHKRWYWLSGSTKIVHKARYSGGTVSVTPDSATVTLSIAPSVSLGSFKNYYFSVEGFDEVYEISSHSAGSTTVTLSSTFQGELNATASYSIWSDRLALPTDCREVVEAYHQRYRKNMEGRGFQEFRQIVNEMPKAEGFPVYFNVTDFYDPDGNDETESTRYRFMRVHPSRTDDPVTINIDYTKEIDPLVDDGDEPLMPIEDRIVLVYGALSRAWTRERNPEESQRNLMLFENKLARMAGKIEEGFDRPKLSVDHRYLTAKRGSRIRGLRSRTGTEFGGASSYSVPKYLEDTQINGANVVGNITVAAGITIDGRDLSVDGAAMDAHIAASQNVHGIGSGNSVVGDGTTQTLTNKTVALASNNIVSATVNEVAQFNSSTGYLESSGILNTELDFLDDVTALSNVNLADNQASAADVLSIAATNTSILIIYSIQRGASNVESGIINLCNDGSTASLAAYGSSVGTSGVTLSADVSGGNVRLRYTSTNTGTAPVFKYKLHKWAA